jgi:hypothetical protein
VLHAHNGEPSLTLAVFAFPDFCLSRFLPFPIFAFPDFCSPDARVLGFGLAMKG